jgi:hypothetical protein
VVVEDFNIPPSQIDRTSRQNINKEILELSDNTEQMDLTDVYRIIPPATRKIYILLSSPWNFHKKDNNLGHKTILNKYNKIEITSCIPPDHNVIKLNNKRSSRKYTNN